MLFNEPKLLKYITEVDGEGTFRRFSALQRAEIAEINRCPPSSLVAVGGFSALQRAEIAEIPARARSVGGNAEVSVLFNEPKLLKLTATSAGASRCRRFSALQRAEIAEISGRS